ncbi:MAG: hypothetical protein KKE44_04150 [Proteobacteria bacterium]|nr:hypothetical protein [Pseudomonadota bacterium]MBU1581922.1 hypothetical protein [Pseudomonadota bacterium]MBU2455673.1 hypothetical protein [Pseudomonadota bacterium]MBU2627405.1 hypothetical protein [Pseudomonadota bacterium]
MTLLLRTIVPHPPPYEEGKGLAYAQELAENTQALSFTLTLAGWLFVMLSGLLAIFGSVLGSIKPDSLGFWEIILSQRGLICSALAVMFAGIGWQVLDRASAATKVTSIATKAILLASTPDGGNPKNGDISAYQACVNAKSSWLEGRMNYERLENIVGQLTNDVADKKP